MQRGTLFLAIFAAFLTGAAIIFLLAPPDSAKKPVATGKALIGGPFTLVNHKGQTITDKDFRGKYMMVYFGYTFCPDICPNELGVISSALDNLGSKAVKIMPIFITVDPERDTVPRMAEYVGNFHNSLVGLTGSTEQVKAAAKAYRVYFSKAKEGGGTADYLVDHSSITFLMGPDGQYVTHFSYGTKPGDMAKKLARIVG